MEALNSGRFVIQEHYARSHHFDFRLEKDGVFKSWAVPKGLPEKPGVKRLAVQVEDHDLEFGTFQGTIPQREYGAGSITVWDHGTYELEKWTTNSIAFRLHGSRVSGRFSLVRFKESETLSWFLMKQLTPREFEVLRLVIAGLLNKQIAAELRIKLRTIKTHRGRVMQKMGVVSVAELVRLAQKASVVPAANGPKGP